LRPIGCAGYQELPILNNKSKLVCRAMDAAEKQKLAKYLIERADDVSKIMF
jgi:hypothetical protein